MRSSGLLLLVILLGACRGDKDPGPSRLALLMAKSWRLSAAKMTVTGGGKTEVYDLYATTPACERDDFRTFSANGTLLFDEGPTKCNATDPQTKSGVWSLNADQTVLTATYPKVGPAYPDNIVELSATTLHVRNNDGGRGVTISIEDTYTAF